MVISKKQNIIKESEKANIENLIKTLETGEDADAIFSQIEKRQLEKHNLEAELAKEKI